MLNWFDGRVSCQETKRYLDNFFAVTRTRPEEMGLAMHLRVFEQVSCLVSERVHVLKKVWPMFRVKKDVVFLSLLVWT